MKMALGCGMHVWCGVPSAERKDRYAHMAIYPYPAHLVSNWQLADAPTWLFARYAGDAKLEQEFVHNLSERITLFRS